MITGELVAGLQHNLMVLLAAYQLKSSDDAESNLQSLFGVGAKSVRQPGKAHFSSVSVSCQRFTASSMIKTAALAQSSFALGTTRLGHTNAIQTCAVLLLT